MKTKIINQNLTTKTGNNCQILIPTHFSFHDSWMAFSLYYSLYKYLTDAEIYIFSARNYTDSVCFSWVNRVGVDFFAHENIGKKYNNPHLNKIYSIYVAIKEEIVNIEKPILVLDPDMVCLKSFDKNLVNKLNDPTLTFGINKSIWFFKNQSLEKFVQALNCPQNITEIFGKPEFLDGLYNETTDINSAVFTCYKERCGQFIKKEWLANKNFPPFGVSDQIGLLELTQNERKVLQLWDRLLTLYLMVR